MCRWSIKPCKGREIRKKKERLKMTSTKSEEIKAFAREKEADFVGVASADCMETTPTRRGPRSVLPEARSVVVFAKRMLTGSIESPSSQVVTSQNLALYLELDRISYVLGCFLEQRGYLVATVPSYNPVEMTSETKGFVGAVSLRHVAQAAGLGVLGKNNLLITPSVGPRVRLGALVTTAHLDPDKPLSKDVCGDCEACIAACPGNALSEPGRTHTGRCLRQALPYGLSRLIAYLTESLDQPSQEIKQSFLNPNFWNLYQSLQVGLQYGCHGCINACPAGTSKPG
jgi:epoxyqueuosine reductase QueG